MLLDAECARRAVIHSERRVVRAGIFDNFGKSDEAAKDAEFQRQQEVLAARRSGKAVEGALKRRAKLKEVRRANASAEDAECSYFISRPVSESVPSSGASGQG